MSATPRQHIAGIVVGDTPTLNFALRDHITGTPVDLAAGTTTVKLRVRKVGAAGAATEVACTKLTGRVLANESIDTAPPYDTAGASVFASAGDYDGEVQVTFSATSQQATPYQLLRIHVRNPVGG